MSRRWLLLMLLAVAATILAAGLAPRFRDRAHEAAPETSLLPDVDEDVFAAAEHILIAHVDSEPPIPGVTRSLSEARELALHISVLLGDKQARFGDLARRYSDDPRVQNSGGYLGVLKRGEIPLEIQVPLFNMEPGDIHPAVETPAGFLVLQRLPVRLAAARHILITWDGSAVTGLRAGRTRNQARLLADEVLLACRRDGADFCDLAARYSDDDASRFECGDLGVLQPTMTDPVFESALFALRAGEISEPVETSFGYHIILRLE